jgi:membrane-associated protein
MNVFLSGILNFMQAYGYAAFGASIFVAAMGVPLPAGPMLLAAGAFASEGEFNVAALLAIATGASVCGDCTGYLVGRLWGSRVLDWLPRSRLGRHIITPQATARSRHYFRRHGASAVFLTRWLLVWFAGATNLVAGTELYPFRSFLVWDVTGEVLGAVIPLALGFAFGASWEAASNLLTTVSLFALGLLSVFALAYYLVRYLLRGRMSRQRQAVQADGVLSAARKDD